MSSSAEDPFEAFRRARAGEKRIQEDAAPSGEGDPLEEFLLAEGIDGQVSHRYRRVSHDPDPRPAEFDRGRFDRGAVGSGPTGIDRPTGFESGRFDR